MKTTVVRKSDIHGKGLFAARDFAAGERVEDIEYEYLWSESRSKFALRYGGRWIMLLGKCRMINSSNDPNVVIHLKRGVVAVKDIRKGEELTSRYASIWT